MLLYSYLFFVDLNLLYVILFSFSLMLTFVKNWHIIYQKNFWRIVSFTKEIKGGNCYRSNEIRVILREVFVMKQTIRYFKEVLFGKYYLEERRLLYWTMMFCLIIAVMMLFLFTQIGRMILLAMALCGCFLVIVVCVFFIVFNIIELTKSFKSKKNYL